MTELVFTWLDWDGNTQAIERLRLTPVTTVILHEAEQVARGLRAYVAADVGPMHEVQLWLEPDSAHVDARYVCPGAVTASHPISPSKWAKVAQAYALLTDEQRADAGVTISPVNTEDYLHGHVDVASYKRPW